MARALNGEVSPTDDAVRLTGQLAAALTREERVVLFTGTAPEARVSTVVAQVALAFARMSQEGILLLDASADAATAHPGFETPPLPGLVEVLEGKLDLDAALRTREVANLWLLPRGRGDADLVKLLGSEACHALLQELRLRFRLIVIDTAPLLRSAPTSILASRADGVVIVVAAGRGQRADVIELQRVLEGLKVKVLGAVLTSADVRAASPAFADSPSVAGRSGAK